MEYATSYDDPAMRVNGYDLAEHVEDVYRAAGAERAVDLGCGTARKLLPLAPHVGRYVGIDVNDRLLEIARRRAAEANAANLSFFAGNNLYPPFPSESQDLVSCFLSVLSPAEAFRVLRPGGLLVLELLGADDKRDLKLRFGSDVLGPRGILLNVGRDERIELLERSLAPFFLLRRREVVEYETAFPPERLVELLAMTPTIRGFDAERDAATVQAAVADDGRVHVREQKIVVVAERRAA